MVIGNGNLLSQILNAADGGLYDAVRPSPCFSCCSRRRPRRWRARSRCTAAAACRRICTRRRPAARGTTAATASENVSPTKKIYMHFAEKLKSESWERREHFIVLLLTSTSSKGNEGGGRCDRSTGHLPLWERTPTHLEGGNCLPLPLSSVFPVPSWTVFPLSLSLSETGVVSI